MDELLHVIDREIFQYAHHSQGEGWLVGGGFAWGRLSRALLGQRQLVCLARVQPCVQPSLEQTAQSTPRCLLALRHCYGLQNFLYHRHTYKLVSRDSAARFTSFPPPRIPRSLLPTAEPHSNAFVRPSSDQSNAGLPAASGGEAEAASL